MTTSCRATDKRPRTLTKAAALVTLLAALLVMLLGADPARSQEEQDESEGPSNGTLSAGDGKAEIESGDNRLFAGDGCALIEGGDETLTAGDCEQSNSGQPQDPDRSDPDPEDASDPEQSSPEGTTPEGTSSEDGEEGSDSPAQEQYEPADEEETSTDEETMPKSTGPEETMLEESASPTDPEQTLCPTDPPSDAVEATVTRAIDGDTVEIRESIEGVDTVRLIGVDTPEMEGEDGDPEPHAGEATRFTADALEGQEVLLEIGDEPQDDYGRLLAYLWLAEQPPEGAADEQEETTFAMANGASVEGAPARTDGSLFSNITGFFSRVVGPDPQGAAARAEDLSDMFNLRLIEGGYAEAFAVEPNTTYEECFEAVEEQARDEGVGRFSTGEDDTSVRQQYENADEEATVSENTALEGTDSESTSPEDGEGPQSPAEEQYEAGEEEETSVEEETLPPENTDPEEAASEETPLEETTSAGPATDDPAIEDADPEEVPTEEAEQAGAPEPPAQEQYEDTEPVEGPDDAGERLEELIALEAARPNEQTCPAGVLLEDFSGREGDESRSIAQTEGPLLLSYDVRPTDEARSEGMLLTSVVDAEGRAVAEPVSFEDSGKQQALLDAEPGSYELQIASVNRDYAFSVYECAPAGPTQQEEEEEPDDAIVVQGPTSAPDTPEPPSGGSDDTQEEDEEAPSGSEDEQDALSGGPAGEPLPTGEADEEADVSYDLPSGTGEPYNPLGAGTPQVPHDEPIPEEALQETLPTLDTPDGPVAMLPDTGGAGILKLAVGCVMISMGSFMFIALRTLERNHSRQYPAKRQRL